MKHQLDSLISEYKNLLPLGDDCQKELDKKFRLEFNYNSNHLEGNTLTYGETKLLLLFDQTKGNHEMREFEEMKAHDVALMMIQEEAKDQDRPLTERFIKDLNKMILVKDFWKDAMTAEGQGTRRKIKVGEYKEYPNSVMQSNGELFEYASPMETPRLISELVQWFNEEAEKGEFSPIELAALLHYRYIRIHPFDDGNGRTARLLVNYVLYRYDLPPVIIKTDNKKEYLRALQQADAGDLQAFVDYMIQQLAWSLDISIKAAKGENIEEQNDWEKQLALLKKGLGDKEDKIVKKSGKVMTNIFSNVLIPFCAIYKDKLSLIDSLFMSTTIGLFWNESLLKEEDILVALSSMSEKKIEKTRSLHLLTIFNNSRQEPTITEISSLQVLFFFDDNAYEIRYDDNRITKLYNDILSKDEMSDIISVICKDLLIKIESALKE